MANMVHKLLSFRNICLILSKHNPVKTHKWKDVSSSIRRCGLTISYIPTKQLGYSLMFVPSVYAWGLGGKKDEKKTELLKSADTILIEQADDLYKENDIIKLYDLLIEHKDSSNDEILWRLARAACDKAKMSADKELKKALMYEAFDIIKRALDINDNNFATHKWFAILLDYTAEFEGTKQRLINSYRCKEHFKRAIELNPTDATSVYLLGYWCFLFADLPWYQRQAASVVFTTPPSSSFEEALQYFEQAESINPQFYSMNLLMLGKTHLRLGNKDKAKQFLLQAKAYPVVTEDDKQANKESIELLRSLGVNVE